MKFYDVRQFINASPTRIWSILCDPPALIAANTGIIRLDGVPSKGAKLKLFSEVDPKRGFSLNVTEFIVERRMIWSGGMPFGLFKGERCFTLTPTKGGTEFYMREEFSGLILPLIWGSMPDLDPSFIKFANGLKAAAEAES